MPLTWPLQLKTWQFAACVIVVKYCNWLNWWILNRGSYKLHAHDWWLTELDRDIRQPRHTLAGRLTVTDTFVMGTRGADRPNGDDLSAAHKPSAVFACYSCREWAVWRRQPAKLSVGSYRAVAGTQLGVHQTDHGTVVGYIPSVQVAGGRHFGWAASRSQPGGYAAPLWITTPTTGCCCKRYITVFNTRRTFN